MCPDRPRRNKDEQWPSSHEAGCEQNDWQTLMKTLPSLPRHQCTITNITCSQTWKSFRQYLNRISIDIVCNLRKPRTACVCTLSLYVMRREAIIPLTLKALSGQIWEFVSICNFQGNYTPVPCNVASYREGGCALWCHEVNSWWIMHL